VAYGETEEIENAAFTWIDGLVYLDGVRDAPELRDNCPCRHRT
jgi:hypothetical protein